MPAISSKDCSYHSQKCLQPGWSFQKWLYPRHTDWDVHFGICGVKIPGTIPPPVRSRGLCWEHVWTSQPDLSPMPGPGQNILSLLFHSLARPSAGNQGSQSPTFWSHTYYNVSNTVYDQTTLLEGFSFIFINACNFKTNLFITLHYNTILDITQFSTILVLTTGNFMQKYQKLSLYYPQWRDEA